MRDGACIGGYSLVAVRVDVLCSVLVDLPRRSTATLIYVIERLVRRPETRRERVERRAETEND